MCENCHKHGEGKKWFLRAENYSDDLVADIRRQRYVQEFLAGQARLVGRQEPMAHLARLPRLARRLVGSVIVRRLATDHYGQVVTLSETGEILALMGAVVRLPCVCRRITTRREQRYCYGFSLRPDSIGAAGLVDPSYWRGPDGTGLEVLTPSQALKEIESLDRLGLVHSIWTFRTPFIGGLCNCGPDDCRAMLATLSYQLPVLHRGETTAAVSKERCVGCGACIKRCRFAALAFDQSTRVAAVTPSKCFGCGLCATACPAGAIEMTNLPRACPSRALGKIVW